MVERAVRDRFAELLRHFLAGRITNYQFEDRRDKLLAYALGDSAVLAAAAESYWLYDDLVRHRLSTRPPRPVPAREQLRRFFHLSPAVRSLPPETVAHFVRWVMFLYTDLEFEWATAGTVPGEERLPNHTNAILALANARFVRQLRTPIPAWARDIYPFAAAADYHAARRSPRLLAGKRG